MAQNDIWVFGYGSLVWQPGFEFIDQQIASLSGYARSFCMRSIHHRGTVDHNGLVLALDAQDGAQCSGVAFRVAASNADETVNYLRERELISSAYLEKVLSVDLTTGGSVPAYCYVIDPTHEQYCQFSLEQQAQMIATAVGGRGPNTEYLYNTAAHLKGLGLEDPELEWLVDRVENLAG